MSEVEKLNAQIAKLQEERDSAMLRERDDVLAKIREQIKAYGFKTSEVPPINSLPRVTYN